MTHTIQFPLLGTIRTAEVNYVTDLSFGDTITLLPEMTETSKTNFTEDELKILSVKAYEVYAVGAGAVVKFKEVE